METGPANNEEFQKVMSAPERRRGPFGRLITAIATASAIAFAGTAIAAEGERTVHGLSLFGTLKYGPQFDRFDYANADAPKGGTLRLSAIGGFDSLNPFILKGKPAQGAGLIYDTLLKSSRDEPSSEYGLLAEKVEYPADFSWVIFNLRPEARWHDGKPVTPEDVIFTFNALTEKGAPHYRYYYANVVKAEKVGTHAVRFEFDAPGNRELPLIMGQLPVLPEHYWRERDFAASTLEPPLGSGPYRIGKVEAGRYMTVERVADYWGNTLPVNIGANNFDEIRFDYYRDDTVALEAFKAGNFDVRIESSAKNWATAYDFAAVRRGKVKRAELTTKNAEPMQAFVLNTRRDKFADPKVRRAFNHAFDFEWANRNLFYDQYSRTMSYFQNSELAASGLPDSEELTLLEPFRDQLPPELFTTPYQPPKTDGTGTNRKGLRTAQKLLADAGWRVHDGILTHQASSTPMVVEFLVVQPTFERVVAPYIQNLERLGMKASIRLVDPAQYQNRLDSFDYDIIIGSWRNSLSPGNEQREYWGSAAAERNGSRNLAGVKNPVVDAMIDKIIFAEDRHALVTASRALDRVLLWGHYVVPQWYTPVSRIAYWQGIQFPDPAPDYSIGFPELWWRAPPTGETIAP